MVIVLKKFYIIKEPFMDMITKYPLCLTLLEEFGEVQSSYMVEVVNCEEIMHSAAFYFQNSIVMEDCFLFMEQSFPQHIDKIECKQYYILFDKEENPFIQLLKRKYRHFFIQDEEIA